MIIALIITSLLFSALSGISKAICDLSEEGKIKGNRYYWHKATSWQRKWKAGHSKNGERFFGSSRWFVMFTDAWHLFGFIHRVTLIKTYIIVGYLVSISNYYMFGILVNYIIFALIFHIFYTNKILRK